MVFDQRQPLYLLVTQPCLQAFDQPTQAFVFASCRGEELTMLHRCASHVIAIQAQFQRGGRKFQPCQPLS
jgi:hypothetical protein